MVGQSKESTRGRVALIDLKAKKGSGAGIEEVEKGVNVPGRGSEEVKNLSTFLIIHSIFSRLVPRVVALMRFT
jgi:hypothetical protein